MSAHGWPEAFLRVLSRDQIIDPNYLFSVFDNGTVYCKACGGPITEDRESHRQFHAAELDELLEERRVDASERRQEALRAARTRKAEKPLESEENSLQEWDRIIKKSRAQASDLGAIADVILGEHGPDCACAECLEAF
jgi:uncharacterized Zn finger protein (UPF0148 family)